MATTVFVSCPSCHFSNVDTLAKCDLCDAPLPYFDKSYAASCVAASSQACSFPASSQLPSSSQFPPSSQVLARRTQSQADIIDLQIGLRGLAAALKSEAEGAAQREAAQREMAKETPRTNNPAPPEKKRSPAQRPPNSAPATRSTPSSSSAPKTGETAAPAAKRAKRMSVPAQPPLAETPSQPKPYRAVQTKNDGSQVIQAPGLKLTYFPTTAFQRILRYEASGGLSIIPQVAAEEWRTVATATDAQSFKAAADAIVARARRDGRLRNDVN